MTIFHTMIVLTMEKELCSKFLISIFGLSKLNVYLFCHIQKGHSLQHGFLSRLSHKGFFQDNFNPLYNCGKEVETIPHSLLSCLSYNNERSTLLNKIRNINLGILENSNSGVTQPLYT